jgi:5-formyltetrahydrofolate cyclo-ligase
LRDKFLQKNRNKREKRKKFSAVLREPKTRKVRGETLAETHTYCGDRVSSREWFGRAFVAGLSIDRKRGGQLLFGYQPKVREEEELELLLFLLL